MSRVAQASDSRPAELFRSACCKGAVLASLFSLLGCGAGGFSLEQAETDRSVLTSSVPANAAPDEPGMVADQSTIRNAVSSADLEGLAGKPIPWANSDTGSRGTITALAESKDRGVLCRSFNASRESFDGVAMFSGEACLVSEGAWRLDQFKAL